MAKKKKTTKKKTTKKKASAAARRKRPKAAPKVAPKAAPRAVQLVARAAASTSKQVDVSLTGGFFHGWVTVDGATVPLGPGGKGQATVTLAPPNVSVAIGMAASGPTTYSLSTTINGVTKSESDTIDGGSYNKTFTYPTSDFNL